MILIVKNPKQNMCIFNDFGAFPKAGEIYLSIIGKLDLSDFYLRRKYLI